MNERIGYLVMAAAGLIIFFTVLCFSTMRELSKLELPDPFEVPCRNSVTVVSGERGGIYSTTSCASNMTMVVEKLENGDVVVQCLCDSYMEAQSR